MNKPQLLITTPLGNVGLETIRAISRLPDRAGVILRAAVQQPAPASLAELVDEVVHFDFADARTFGPALRGIDRVLLVRPPALADVDRYFRPFIDELKRAGVGHVTFLSLQGVEHNPLTPHHQIEALIRDAGLNYTMLRPCFFMQNLSTTHRDDIRDRNEIFVPAGHGRTAFVDVRDLAEVAALSLVFPEQHSQQAYELTGSDALTYDEIAGVLSEVLNRPIRYANPSVWAFVYREWHQNHQKMGFVLIMVALYTVTKLGRADHLTGEVQRLLGRAPRSFRQFAEDNRTVWQPDPAGSTHRTAATP